ncbi:MAG TPA: T9SS type A sorting domain-containing protein [Bacteroidales bacterium]|nr:T9SS type A sorting domain-containing protein [Bacteroidales bacterium]HPT08887.1 T9SS type A sorting domain-containing protein [Bacteroidales bacterium]
MKQLIRFSFLLSVIVLTYGFSGSDLKYPGGSPAGYTGSPADGQNCVGCHGGSVGNVTGWITSNVPAAGYTPGASYTITVTVTGTGKKGFEVSPQSLTGTLLGTLTPGTGSKFASSNPKYITQTSGVNTNPAVWNFTWTAPAAGTGTVTFYGAFTINKPVTKLSTLEIPENVNTAVPDQEQQAFSVYPNPVSEALSISYSYDQRAFTRIDLLTVSGQKVRQLFAEEETTGDHTQTFRLRGIVIPGIYFVQLTTDSQSVTKKIIVL